MAGIEIGKGKYKSDKSFVPDYVDYVIDKKLEGYNAHMSDKSNPHAVTKAQVGLPNADDTSDLNKPISNATRAALDTKADKAEVEAALETKADKSYVDSGLADKADGYTVYAALDTKADKTAVEAIHSNTVNIRNLSGGAAVGDGAESLSGGGAVGKNALAQSGGALGNGAETSTGGAVGDGANSVSGGFAGGYRTSAQSGAAVGNGAFSQSGGAVGDGASSTFGGAVGDNAKAGVGFAGGKAAKAVDSNNNGIDAIQLGTGTNSAPKTLQVYSHQLMDENGKIPGERLDDTLAKQLPHITWDGLDSFTGRAALVHDDEDDIAISPAEATNGTRNLRAHLLLQSTFYPIRHDGSIQDEPFQDGSESYLQTLYKLDGTVQQRRYEAYGSNPNVWSAWEIVGHAHTHANASVLDATTAAYTAEEQERITTLQNDLGVFSYDLNILQNDVMDNIAPKAHTHANATVLDAITAASLVGTQGVNIDSSLVDITDLDSLPNGLTQVPYSDGAGAGGYLVFTSLNRSEGMDVGCQIKISTDATLWRWCGYGEWGAWQMQTDALLAPIVTKTDTGTSFYFGSPGVYQLQRTTDAAKQLTFYTPSDAQKTKVNELELYLTVTAGDSVLWPAGTLFSGGEIPTFTPGHYYRVIAEYHPLAQAWCVGVIEDFAAV